MIPCSTKISNHENVHANIITFILSLNKHKVNTYAFPYLRTFPLSRHTEVCIQYIYCKSEQ